MIRVSELKLPIEGNQKALEKKLAKALRVPVEEIKAYRIFKRSLDARKKDNIHYAYVVDVEVKNEKKILEKNKDKNISKTPDLDYKMLKGERMPEKRPVFDLKAVTNQVTLHTLKAPYTSNFGAF